MAVARAPAHRVFTGLVCVRAVDWTSPDGLFVKARGTTDGDDEVVLVGSLAHLLPGELVHAAGRWDRHPTHGEQLRLDQAAPARLTDPEEVRAFVATTAGVGPACADAVMAAGPDDALERVDADPRAAFTAAGVPRVKLAAAAGDWRERRRTHALRTLLAAHGLDRVVAHVARALGPTAAARLREDPHLLCERFGVPLAVGDALAETAGATVTPERRAQAAIVLVLRAATADGHTALPTYLALGRAARLAGDAADDAALASLAGRGLVAVAPGRVQLRLLAEQERRVGRWLRGLAGRREPLGGAGRTPPPAVPLTAEQREAVQHVFGERLTVVTGGPGTGKTTLVREVAAIAKARRLGLELCAPTGKAAQRLAHTTGRPAATIHRLAGLRPDEEDAPVDLTAPFDPRLADVEPLECDLLVVDEASMLTVELAAMLLALLPEGAHLVLIGDPDQLPPVGAGNVLADVVGSGHVPVARLTEVKRQGPGSHIVRAAGTSSPARCPRPPRSRPAPRATSSCARWARRPRRGPSPPTSPQGAWPRGSTSTRCAGCRS
jgi:exodeoxyribonuclease V alpha subunit